jgi:choline-sulfatase
LGRRCAGVKNERMRPNILFIMADQFRADALGCVGGEVHTPNLDSLAARGWLFTNAYANSAECIPSRISLATGLYPHQTGVLINEPCTLDPAFPNWMQSIEAAGYATSLFGKTHLHPHSGDLRDRRDLMHRYGLQTVDEIGGPRASAALRSNMTELWERRGVWERYRDDFKERFETKPFVARPSTLPLDLYYDVYVGRTARDHLRTLPVSHPWFCWVSFSGPHEPWDAPEPYASMYDAATLAPALPKPPDAAQRRGLLKGLYASQTSNPTMTAAEIGAMRANYAGNVTLIDDEIGRTIALIEERGEMNNTLILFTSDHGEMNGDHGLVYKGNFLDPAIKVPLIVVPPGGTAARRSSALVELMDVGATLTDYAKGEQPAPSLARSLRPLMAETSATHRSVAISEFAGHTCVVKPDIKVEFDRDATPVLAFDRAADEDEQVDVSGSAAHAARIAALRNELGLFRNVTPALRATMAQRAGTSIVQTG